ncbi:MAG: DUF805 domain-containing protein [Beijerinckiaceae bacterium]
MTELRFFYYEFSGRLSRLDFWCAGLALAAALLGLSLATEPLPETPRHFIMGVAYTASIWPGAALVSKRLQDRGRNGLLCWLFVGLPVFMSAIDLVFRPSPFNPVAVALSALYVPTMLWAAVDLCLLEGTPGVNAWGEDPREADAGQGPRQQTGGPQIAG